MKTLLLTVISTMTLALSANAQVAFHFPSTHVLSEITRTPDCREYSRPAALPKEFNFRKFANERLQYPELARTYGIEGAVIVQINVAPSGKTQFIKIVKSLGYGCDAEAIKMTDDLPDFIPAVFKGRLIPSYVNLEIRFKM